MQIVVGDRVRISGGYDVEPVWLHGELFYTGTICSFIPGQNSTPALVVELDHPIKVDAVTGRTVVLELRYEDAVWTEENVVHVELCDFVPEAKPWQHRRQGSGSSPMRRVPECWAEDVASRKTGFAATSTTRVTRSVSNLPETDFAGTTRQRIRL